MKITRAGIVSLLFGALTLFAGNAEAETIIVRSGNGSIGGRDSQVNMLVGPANSPFSELFSAGDFENSKNGADAFIVAPHVLWGTGLPGDSISHWISTNSGGAGEGSTALYAISFAVFQPFNTATLDLNFMVDNLIGGGLNEGVYLNGVALSGTSGQGGFSAETIMTGIDIGSMLVAGENTLFINAADVGSASGLLFRATIETSQVAVPEPGAVALFGAGLACLGVTGKRKNVELTD
ncbi:MAG: PEP-CTERM sorting domain-containing protein [Chlorobiaceae bacterium]|nr:PEP-CTERM sorting domain-containing protein [Chlorobiaceae bacterium]